MLLADYGHRWMTHGGHRPWLWMTIGLLVMAAFWVLVIWAGMTLVRRGQTSNPAPQQPAAPHADARPTAEQILAERLALGEIGPEDYRLRLEVLRSSAPTSPPNAG